MIDSTTHESLKGYYEKVPFTPYSSGSMLKNLFTRITESTPSSLLEMPLRVKEKILVHETKAALERKFDIKKTVLETQDNEYNMRKQEHKARLQQLFRKEILPPINKPVEYERRVDLSEEFGPSSSSSMPSKDEEANGSVGELEENKSESVYNKIKRKNYPPLQFKNPSAKDEYKENDENKRPHSAGTSSSSFLETEKEKGGSVATFNKSMLFRGVEQSEIAKQGGGESDFTSTIRGAINQITSIVDAQKFKFNKNKRIKKEKSEGLENALEKSNQLIAVNDDKLFKVVSYEERNKFVQRNIEFAQTEKRNYKPTHLPKTKSEADFYNNPYQLQRNLNEINRTPSECRNVEPIDLDSSLDSIRRREFNQEVPIPKSGRI